VTRPVRLSSYRSQTSNNQRTVLFSSLVSRNCCREPRTTAASSTKLPISDISLWRFLSAGTSACAPGVERDREHTPVLPLDQTSSWDPVIRCSAPTPGPSRTRAVAREASSSTCPSPSSSPPPWTLTCEGKSWRENGRNTGVECSVNKDIKMTDSTQPGSHQETSPGPTKAALQTRRSSGSSVETPRTTRERVPASKIFSATPGLPPR